MVEVSKFINRHSESKNILTIEHKADDLSNRSTFLDHPVYTAALKENCNAETSRFHLKGRSKSFKIRPKSLKSAKPFSRYSTLKI